MEITKRLNHASISEKEQNEEFIYEDGELPKRDNANFFRDNLFNLSNVVSTTSQVYTYHVKDDIDEDFLEISLCEDVYSILYVCKSKSISMVFCICVILVQYALLGLLLHELTSFSDKSNPFDIPSLVDSRVIFGQFLGIILIIASQDDFINAVSFFYDGYSPEILIKAPYATKTKYYISGCLKLVNGMMYILINLIVVVQSTAVVGMFLNFAALNFICSTDDIFFHLAGKFFFTDDLGILVHKIKNLKVPVPHRVPSFKDAISSYRFMNYCYISAALFIYWITVIVHQLEGRFACQSILVQFDDTAIPYLPQYSGAYDRVRFMGTPVYRYNRRFIYLKRDDEKAFFSYCNQAETWTFSILEDNQSYGELDPCKNYAAMSEETETYDIEDTSRAWFARNNVTDEAFRLDAFTLITNECSDCHGNGKCVDSKCLCDEGVYGINCEFTSDKLCKELYEIRDGESFIPNVDQPFVMYETSPITKNFDRPIFFRNIEDGRGFDIIEFNGFRWEYIHAPDIIGTANVSHVKGIIKETMNKENFTSYFSESVIFGTPRDDGSPAIHYWYEPFVATKFPTINENRPKNTWLLCPDCSLDNTCQNSGTCNQTTKRCDCKEGYEGVLCEKKL